VYECVCMYECMYVCMNVRVYVYVYVYMYVCMHVRLFFACLACTDVSIYVSPDISDAL